jgi:hypothetical protein
MDNKQFSFTNNNVEFDFSLCHGNINDNNNDDNDGKCYKQPCLYCC